MEMIISAAILFGCFYVLLRLIEGENDLEKYKIEVMLKKAESDKKLKERR